jgi:class 3 adenylate cyclase
VKVPPSSSDLGKANVASGAPTVTILFISLSAAQYNLESDWAEAGTKVIVRHCPICVEDSIIGHGRRRKQLMMSTTIGSGFAVVFATAAAKHSPSCRPSRRPTAITA